MKNTKIIKIGQSVKVCYPARDGYPAGKFAAKVVEASEQTVIVQTKSPNRFYISADSRNGDWLEDTRSNVIFGIRR